jgi:hypothetical protein
MPDSRMQPKTKACLQAEGKSPLADEKPGMLKNPVCRPRQEESDLQTTSINLPNFLKFLTTLVKYLRYNV